MKKLRELLLYIAVAVGVVVGAIALGNFVKSYSRFVFICFTVILGATLTKMYWPSRKHLKMWVLLLTFLTVHCAAYVMLLRYMPNWPGFAYLLTGPTEVVLFAIIAKVGLDILPPNVKNF